jgi:hypothetical protein
MMFLISYACGDVDDLVALRIAVMFLAVQHVMMFLPLFMR